MDLLIDNNEKIEDMIYEIRGKQVMLDSDLARLYKCVNGTKTINLAVKRHINRFPERFMFQLTKEEYNDLRFQFETTNNMSRTLPYVFTEQGVAMLATILRTEVAEEISIRIMDAFVVMRHYIGTNEYRLSNVEYKIIEHDKSIKLLQELFNKFEEKRKIYEIYFNGQIYEAYSKIVDIMKEAIKELIVIDIYADKNVLDIISKINVKVLLIVKENTNLSKLDIDKYNKEYSNLAIVYDNSFHDRYIIIDNSIIYHLGASINHAESKTFSINILLDEFVKNSLIDKINKLI